MKWRAPSRARWCPESAPTDERPGAKLRNCAIGRRRAMRPGDLWPLVTQAATTTTTKTATDTRTCGADIGRRSWPTRTIDFEVVIQIPYRAPEQTNRRPAHIFRSTSAICTHRSNTARPPLSPDISNKFVRPPKRRPTSDATRTLGHTAAMAESGGWPMGAGRAELAAGRAHYIRPRDHRPRPGRAVLSFARFRLARPPARTAACLGARPDNSGACAAS